MDYLFQIPKFFLKIITGFLRIVFVKGAYWKASLIMSLVFLMGSMFFTTPVNACPVGSANYILQMAQNDIGFQTPCSQLQSQLRDNTAASNPVVKPASFQGVSLNNTNTTSSVDEDSYLNTYYRYGGAIGAVMFLGGMTMDVRPASTMDAVMFQANQAGIVANAQVTGFNQFGPIGNLWALFRNIALILFVVVFLAIGFFILIQRKIGGQETVSLVSSLTNSGIAMIVIVFSYAIGGLMVDLFINVMNGIVATTFNGLINSQEILNGLNRVNSGINVLTLMNDLTHIGVSQSAVNLFQTTLTGLTYPAAAVKQVFQGINYNAGVPIIGSFPIGGAIGVFSSAFVDILTGIITTAFNDSALINAIVAFIIFITMVRVVFALIGAYVSLIFKILFSPFILLPAALPGNGVKTVTGWLLSLLSSALVFPAIFAAILMAAMFLNLSGNVTSGSVDECKYVSTLNPGNTSTITGNTGPSKYFVVTRLGRSTSNDNSEQTACFPLALPTKFNYWPAPIGYIQGVEPDDLIRFVIALTFIIAMPSIPKIIQQLLNVPQNGLLGGAAAGLRGSTSAFAGFISSIPSFGIGRAIGSVARSATENAQ